MQSIAGIDFGYREPTVVLHGATVTPVMRGVERRLSAEERSRRTKDPASASPQEKEPSLA